MGERLRRGVTAALLCSSFLSAAGSPGSVTPAESPLLVMLQGSDTNALTAGVTRAGGSITHSLPIIDAIGATLTRDQLEQVRESTPGITRIIDDLAWEPETPPDTRDDCGLAGSIELLWQNHEATWVLFNKGEQELVLDHLKLSWKEPPPTLVSASLSGNAIDLSTAQITSDSVDLTLRHPIGPGERQQVLLSFRAGTPDRLEHTHHLSLRATAGAECVAKLPPRYDDFERDSYFAEVSGAAALHSHGITGAGITVAVLDSGLWEENQELSHNTKGQPRVVARYDAIEGRTVDLAFDESGHGTHMTSVLARSGPVTRPGATQPSYRGIAPDANIVVVKAFGESGEAGFLDLVRGIQWVVDNHKRFNIRVLNLSFAARPRWPYWDDPINQALMRAWQAGIFIAAAAGNEGPEPMTVGSPGNLPYLMTVGALTDSWTENDRNDDYIPDFSSRGPTPMGHIKPDLVAAGGHMAGFVRPGSTLATQFPEYFLSTGEFVMTGSSQATAVVSGMAALMLQLNPDSSNDDLKCMLRTSAEPAISEDGRLAYSPFVQGEGRASLLRAITIGSPNCEQSDLNLAADIAGQDHFQGPAVFSETSPPSLPGDTAMVSEAPDEEGPIPLLRWGAREHLERLKARPSPYPIDWLRIFASEQNAMRSAAEQ